MFIKVGFYKLGLFPIGQYPLECYISLCFKMYNEGEIVKRAIESIRNMQIHAG